MAEYFGADLALAQHILGLPANQMSPCPRGPGEGGPSFALLRLMQAMQVELQGTPFMVPAKPMHR